MHLIIVYERTLQLFEQAAEAREASLHSIFSHNLSKNGGLMEKNNLFWHVYILPHWLGGFVNIASLSIVNSHVKELFHVFFIRLKWFL